MSKISVLRFGCEGTLIDIIPDLLIGQKVFNTSGTTGIPKLLTHKISSLVSNAKAFNQVGNINPDTVMYHCFPLNYMAGLLNTIISPLVADGSVVIGPEFNSLGFWRKPLDNGCNTMWLVPTMAEALVRVGRDPSIRQAVESQFTDLFCGTAPLSPDLRTRWLDKFGVPLRNSYGTSEALLISVQDRDDAMECIDDCGYVIPGVTAFQDQESNEILVCSNFSQDVVSRTGDNGDVIPCEGNMHKIRIHGRIDDLIIKGGVNIDPRTIEQAVLGIDGVTDAIAMGIEHEFWGQDIILFVETQHQSDEIQKHNPFANLPKSSIPTTIMCVPEFPRTNSWKIRRKELRSMIG